MTCKTRAALTHSTKTTKASASRASKQPTMSEGAWFALTSRKPATYTD
ncbi:hypothetical protein CCACVL1_29143 [Corchorus capsularis]|uniref:Uncharacterized protein n=1 Tax=Corchorus capsularis TaxID=210143 RepID=A0A1R3G3I7_COCAP|nr:hypothetical protein CCACVL1_29143 [Corchorus capsularis]